ncbi:MAG: UvrD-helicase domain-containing protein [Candidatus Eisenbacteria sp.]|nr:UvrD-helicase domain-containing protein [Candidatus Eisenbacteria bacterium]
MTERAQTTGFSPTPEQDLAARVEAPYVLVSASAGTGKTRTLIDRVLRVLNDGIDLDRLLVITFTQKAAGELKQRLQEAFISSTRLRPLRMMLPQANVSTIDSFCSRLLREHAVAAQIDPAFRVLSSPNDQIAMAGILDELFHHWYLGRPPSAAKSAAEWAGIPKRDSPRHHEFLRLIELCRFRNSREILKRELEHLLRLARVHPDPDEFVDRLAAGLDQAQPAYVPAYARILRQNWKSAVLVYARMLKLGERELPKKDLSRHTALLNHLVNAPAPWNPGRENGGQDTTPAGDEGENRGQDTTPAGDLVADLRLLQAHLEGAGVLTSTHPWAVAFPTLPRGTADLLRPFNERAKDLLNGDPKKRPGPFQWLPRQLEDINRQYSKSRLTLKTLLALLRQLMNRYEAYKQERGLLDFSDLELHTRRLLNKPPSGLLERFDMVMVDEFQDVNRLQAEIVELLRPARGRFLVGDVKQCIYQFRLSDPTIFRELFRGAKLLQPGPNVGACAGGEAQRVRIHLSTNFRSRRPVLETVNYVFDSIFTPEMIGGPYADQALRLPEPKGASDQADVRSNDPAHGSSDPTSDRSNDPGPAPVEIHIFEKPGGSSPGTINPRLAAEARLVAKRIRTLREEGFSIYDRKIRVWRGVQYGDMAVILRSPRPNGPPFAGILRKAGIPVAFGGQDFFDREEVRDALSLLRILNNAHDDVSLAAVLRSPASDFTDEDLVHLRAIWPRSLSLLATLRATATGREDEWSGPIGNGALLESAGGETLSGRCRRFLDALDRWRTLAQAGDLSVAIAAALEESGLMEASAASESGSGRLGNLEQLLALTRRHCQDQDHSLPGLMRAFEEIELSGAGPETVVEDEGSQNAVRILSLHKAKGLEFPVVFLSLTGQRINDIDVRNNLLTGEDWIGVDLFDPQAYLRTPTIARNTLSQIRKQEIREEEMRILYVAFTRAREKLIITGTVSKKWDKLRSSLRVWETPGPVPESLLLQATSPLDWIMGTLSRHDLMDRLDQSGQPVQVGTHLALQRHTPRASETPVLRAQEGAPAPHGSQMSQAPPTSIRSQETLAEARSALPGLAARLQKRYSHETATTWRGKFWVTEIKRLIDQAIHDDEREQGASLGLPGMPGLLGTPAHTYSAGAAQWTAAEEGSWLHAVLEAVDPCRAAQEHVMQVASELASIGRVSSAWVTDENLEPVTRFFSSPLGKEMREIAGGADRTTNDILEREVSFSLRLSPSQLARIWPPAGELDDSEWLLVQGQIDALWPRGDGTLVVLDFKSDRVSGADEIKARAHQYRPQMLLYREAAARMWKAPRVECWLHFLRPGKAVRAC